MNNYDNRMSLVLEHESALESKFEEGMEKGMEKGMIESAKRMKAKGSTFDYISEITGLSIEEIEML